MTRNLPNLFVSLILGAGVIVGGLFYVKPAWSAFGSTRQEANYLQQISEDLDAVSASYDALLNQVNALSQDDVDRIEAALPTQQNAADFLTGLEALANRHGLALKQIDITNAGGAQQALSGIKKTVPRPAGADGSNQNAGAPSREIPISLSVSGSYEAFKAFLRDLEHMNRIMDVQSLSFAGKEQNSFDFSIKLQAYSQE